MPGVLRPESGTSWSRGGVDTPWGDGQGGGRAMVVGERIPKRCRGPGPRLGRVRRAVGTRSDCRRVGAARWTSEGAGTTGSRTCPRLADADELPGTFSGTPGPGKARL